MKKKKKIGFIGTGNMAEALIAGLLKAKFIAPEQIMAFDSDARRLRFIQKKYGVKKASDNNHVSSQCNPLVFCVKPQSMKEVVEEIADSLDPSKLLISIAAGVPLYTIETYARKQLRLIRAMPISTSLSRKVPVPSPRETLPPRQTSNWPRPSSIASEDRLSSTSL